MSRSQRPVQAVPAWIRATLLACVAGHAGLQAMRPPPAHSAVDLPAAPRAETMRIASFGETAALARLAMLYVQTFDLGAGNALPYQRLDYARLVGWLRALLDVDPKSGYPLFSAARVYAETNDSGRSRAMLQFVHQAYLEDPNRRWPWLAHAALLAKHQLKDLPLARRYAADIQRLTTDPKVPYWAKQMEVFILEDMNELEAAKVMLGGLLATGRIRSPEERRFLKGRLEELERRLASKP